VIIELLEFPLNIECSSKDLTLYQTVTLQVLPSNQVQQIKGLILPNLCLELKTNFNLLNLKDSNGQELTKMKKTLRDYGIRSACKLFAIASPVPGQLKSKKAFVNLRAFQSLVLLIPNSLDFKILQCILSELISNKLLL
jgi:hypothetical protein